MSTLATNSAVVMPRLSDSMEEGTILSWLLESGAAVARGEPLCEIETDKATMVYESDREGTLTIVVGEGETAKVGELIAFVGAAPADDSDLAATGAAEIASPLTETTLAAGSERPAGGRVPASPLARRIAAERGISLEGRRGRGPGGRIAKADVLSWTAGAGVAEAAPPQPSPSAAKPDREVRELTAVQSVIARRMAEAQTTVPDFQVTAKVEMDAAAELRQHLRDAEDEEGVTPSFNDLIVKAAALTLRTHPRVNGAYVDGHFELSSSINVNVAVAVSESLLTPTITGADRLGLGEIARRSRSLVERCRDGTVTPAELAGGTFTISNLGMFGVESLSAIVNSGQAAILGVGAIAAEPVVRDGEMAVGRVMRITLSCDHRILYGADAAAFLADLRQLLEDPVRMLL